SSGAKYCGPSGRSSTSSSRSSAMPSPVFALTGWSAWKSPSCAAAAICVAMWAGFRRSTLFRAITTGTPSENTRCAMKRSPAPISQDERVRQEVVRRVCDHATMVVGIDNAVEPELDEPLAAAAARRRRDRNRLEVARPPPRLRDGARDRRPLGAHSERIRRVLDVHALPDTPVAAEE